MPNIYGIQPVKEALEAGKTIYKVWIQKNSGNPLLRDLITELKKNNIPFQYVPSEKIKKLVPGKNHQGIVALITDIEFRNIEAIVQELFEEGKVPFLLILDKITDVRNFGSIARTSECMGVHAIIFPAHGSASLNEDAVKTSAGALMHIPLCREFNLKKTMVFLKQSGIKIVAVHEKTQKRLSEIDLTQPIALLLGNEEKGISREYLKFCDYDAKLPMQGKIASLNVSNAAAMAIYETIRQRLT